MSLKILKAFLVLNLLSHQIRAITTSNLVQRIMQRNHLWFLHIYNRLCSMFHHPTWRSHLLFQDLNMWCLTIFTCKKGGVALLWWHLVQLIGFWPSMWQWCCTSPFKGKNLEYIWVDGSFYHCYVSDKTSEGQCYAGCLCKPKEKSRLVDFGILCDKLQGIDNHHWADRNLDVFPLCCSAHLPLYLFQ